MYIKILCRYYPKFSNVNIQQLCLHCPNCVSYFVFQMNPLIFKSINHGPPTCHPSQGCKMVKFLTVQQFIYDFDLMVAFSEFLNNCKITCIKTLIFLHKALSFINQNLNIENMVYILLEIKRLNYVLSLSCIFSHLPQNNFTKNKLLTIYVIADQVGSMISIQNLLKKSPSCITDGF